MSTNLPAEYKAQLAHLPQADVQRLSNMLDRGITAPLTPEKESGPFVLFIMGNGLDEIASMTGTPKDVVMLTYLKYRWEDKKKAIVAAGTDELVKSMQKEMVNLILAATNKVLKDQIAAVMSGKLAPEKCTFLPRSGHGLKQLMEMVSAVNNLQPQNDKPGNTIVQAQNVQINQQLTSEDSSSPTVKRVSREERLAKLAESKE